MTPPVLSGIKSLSRRVVIRYTWWPPGRTAIPEDNVEQLESAAELVVAAQRALGFREGHIASGDYRGYWSAVVENEDKYYDEPADCASGA